MYETVSVKDAIKRGQMMVNIPVGIIFFAIPIIGTLLNRILYVPVAVCVIGSILGILILPWLYWSYSITKWRIWAYENVRNIHDLKKQAINANLIWPDGSFFEKTEIRTADDKYKLSELETKLDIPDVITDDYTVLEETIINYSKVQIYGGIILGLIAIGSGFYLFDFTNTTINFILCLGIGITLVITQVKNALIKRPIIVLNNKGIATKNVPFVAWADVQYEEVIREGFGRNIRYFLFFNYPGGTERSMSLS